MRNVIPHYQTSFRVEDPDGKAFRNLQSAVYGWILTKETDKVLKEKKSDFFYRAHWTNLYNTRSELVTETCLSEQDGNAWAVEFTELDGEHGKKRHWYSDIGLKQNPGFVVVSVRISYALNADYLNNQPPPPDPSVPKVMRYILRDNIVFSGHPDFRLSESPLEFKAAGTGKTLCEFIKSPARLFPIIVFNGDSEDNWREAQNLARKLTGKAQIVVIARNDGLASEIQFYLDKDYRIEINRFRVFLPFGSSRNFPERHRYYNASSPEYGAQQQNIINGLLRHHSLLELGVVDSVTEVKRLLSREKLLRLRLEGNSTHKEELDEFYKLFEEVEKDRDRFKNEATIYAAEVDQRETEIKQLTWQCNTLKGKLEEKNATEAPFDMAAVFPSLPRTLLETAQSAQKCCSRLIITESALKSADDYNECKSLNEAWQMLLHLNNEMHRIKFEDTKAQDWEQTFADETGYELAMSEGKQTKGDKKLMRLRQIEHDGKLYDITPHIKFGNQEPKLVRIYFDFNEIDRKIIVGHIGKHIPNATSKSL